MGTGTETGVAMAEDLSTGMVDRFRSLPIAGRAVLAGRVAADALRNLFVTVLMIAVGAAVGFRFHAGPAASLAAVAFAVAAGVAFSWLNLLLGLAGPRSRIRRAGRAVPRHHLVLHQLHPGPGRHHARLAPGLGQSQPITVLTSALRALCLGGPTARPAIEAAAWLAGLLAMTIPAAGRPLPPRGRHLTWPLSCRVTGRWLLGRCARGRRAG